MDNVTTAKVLCFLKSYL